MTKLELFDLDDHLTIHEYIVKVMEEKYFRGAYKYECIRYHSREDKPQKPLENTLLIETRQKLEIGSWYKIVVVGNYNNHNIYLVDWTYYGDNPSPRKYEE